MKRLLILLGVLVLLVACSPAAEPAAETAASEEEAVVETTTDDAAEADEHMDEEGDEHMHEEGDEHEHDDEKDDEHMHEEGDEHDHEHEEGDEHMHEEGDEHEHGDDHDHDDEHDHSHDAEAEALMLPELEEAALDGEMLQVVATTSIVGDIVAQVGGDAIALTTLMGPGQDPHSYEPAARDLTAVASANVVFVNGWGLEEGLVEDLEEIGETALLVPISAGIEPLEFGEDGHDHGEHEEGEHSEDEHEHEEGEHSEDEHEHEEGEHSEEGDEHDHGHSGADPHVWFDVHNIEKWVANVEQILSTLDPANADTFSANAAAYIEELEALEAYVEEQIAQIPAEQRLLVTNHDALGYFAEAYDFTIIGTVIPSQSTLAEPSAADLADLIVEMEEYGLCTIFTETTISDSLAQTVAGELDGCAEVQVLPIYTGAIGPAGSGADSYIGMLRANVDNIVAGLGN